MDDTPRTSSAPPQPPVGQSTAAQPTRRTAQPTRRTALGVLGGLVAAGAIGTAAYGSISSASSGGDLRGALNLIAPAAAGGGWDAVAREMQAAQRENSIVRNPQVLNQPGAGGTIALSNVHALAGHADTLLIGGTGLLAATIQFASAVAFTDVPPLATLVEEYDAIIVPEDSPHQDLESLLNAWRADPHALPVSGGGSFDQLVVTDLAVKAGIPGAELNYISSDGGGEVVAALMNGTVQAAASGLPDTRDQVESGRLRALALVAKERIDGFDVPTTVELGYDVTLSNWRSISAPPGLTDAEYEELRAIVLETIETPEWAEAVERFSWAENVQTGEELDRFLADQDQQIRTLFEEMGA